MAISEKFNSDSFAPFLKAVRSSEAQAAPSDLATIGLLQKLVLEPGGKMEVGSLLSAVELPADRFATALREFEKAGLLETMLENGRQVVALKPLGEQVARVKI